MSSKSKGRSAQQRRAQAEAQARAAAAEKQSRRKRLVAWVLILALGLTGVGSIIAMMLSGNNADAADQNTNEPIVLPTALPDGDSGYVLHTSVGDLEVELFGDAAPIAVGKMVELAAAGYFDGNTCHRLTTYGERAVWDTMKILQCGSHDGTGIGDPDITPWGPVENAPQADVYLAGTIAMARVGGQSESMTSQFFIVFEDSYIPSDEAGGYTVIGKVVAGLDQIQAVGDAGVTGGGYDGAPATPVVIEGVDIP